MKEIVTDFLSAPIRDIHPEMGCSEMSLELNFVLPHACTFNFLHFYTLCQGLNL